MRVSNPAIYYAILFKDFFYHVWHFYLKFNVWVLAFTTACFHVDDRTEREFLNELSKTMRVFYKVSNFMVWFLGIPRRISRTWDLVIDCSRLRKMAIMEMERRHFTYEDGSALSSDVQMASAGYGGTHGEKKVELKTLESSELRTEFDIQQEVKQIGAK